MRSHHRTLVRTAAAIALGLAVIALVAGAPPAHADGVRVGVTIAAPPPVVVVAPPPPPVIVAPAPRLVVVPGSPVYYAPALDVNYFVYSGRRYTFHDGHWFMTARHGAPWAFVPVERVPQPLLAVPVGYYKVPPGHAKKLHKSHPHGNGNHKHHGKKKHKDD